MVNKRVDRSCSSFVGLHGWEEQNFLDAIGVSHKHSQSVNTDTPTGGWWETIFEGSYKVHVNGLSFIITEILGFGLVLEFLKLDLWIVQFGVSIDDFMVVNEKLESLSQSFFTSVPFG